MRRASENGYPLAECSKFANCKSFCLPGYCYLQRHRQLQMNQTFLSRIPVLFGSLFRVILCVLVLTGSVGMFAQAQDPEDIVTTDVSLVQLNVGVVDPQGRAVTSLSRNDFTIYEDGVKQPILHFEPTHAPF